MTDSAEADDTRQQRLFPALGLKSSYIDMPSARMPDYAQGYKKDGSPIRMSPGVLSAEAYGVKTTATDLTHFLQANMNLLQIDGTWQRAVTATHTGYFTAGVMTQDLNVPIDDRVTLAHRILSALAAAVAR